VLIICYYFAKKYRSNILAFIGIANGWCAIYGITTFCIYSKEIFIAWYSQNPYEGYTFQYSRGSFNSVFSWAFFGQLILLLLIAIMFCLKKNRKKIRLSFLQFS
jgi:molybdopterin-containing oxidoreductase family membrane subunit